MSAINPATTAPARDVGIDLLRVAAIAAVVCGHLVLPEPLRNAIYGWHVPLFFFLSGWFYRPGRPPIQEVRGRWMSVGRPYVFWLVLIGALEAVVSVVHGGMSLRWVGAHLWGGAFLVSPFSAFWFMSALIMAAVLYRVLADGVSPHAALALGLLACGAARLAPEIVAKTPLAAGQALIALVFVYAGHQVASSPALRRGPVWGVPVAAVGIGLFAVGLVEPLDLKAASLGTPVLSVLTALAVCWGLTTAARAVRSCGIRADRAIVSLAATGTGVIYVHAVLIWGLHAVGHGEGPLLPTFCLVLAGSWSAALLLARTPLRGWALGRAPAPPPLSR